MKLKLKHLHQMFKQDITVDYIAERLICCSKSVEDYKEKAKIYMKKRDFDILGLKENGITLMYITIEGEERNIEIIDIVDTSTPIIDILHLMRDKSRLFILEGNKVECIVTRGDLLKAPGLLLFFGLIILFETQCTYLIESFYSNNSWQKKISNGRLNKAKELLDQRKVANENLSLIDCIQFCDKTDINLKNQNFLDILKDIGIDSVAKGNDLFKRARILRNNLAHGQDIRSGTSWEELIDTIEKIEELNKIIEVYLERHV